MRKAAATTAEDARQKLLAWRATQAARMRELDLTTAQRELEYHEARAAEARARIAELSKSL